jgi:predicted GNAT family acetyltransferase
MTSLPTVIDNPSERQYELWLGDERVGLATYAQTDGVVTVPHVETDPAHKGQGYAALLMDGVVDDLRARPLKIRPLCPYAASYMRDRPDTHDLYA